jgi:hypothetical protein
MIKKAYNLLIQLEEFELESLSLTFYLSTDYFLKHNANVLIEIILLILKENIYLYLVY